MQTSGIDPIYTTGGQQVALLHVRPSWNKLQFERAPQGGGVTIGHMARTCASVHHWNALPSVSEHGHFAHQGVDPRDLTQYTRSIDDRRAWFNTGQLTTIDHHTVAVGIGGAVQHLHGLGGTRELFAQFQQFSQLLVFLQQLLHLLQTLGLPNGSGLKALRGIACFIQIHKIIAECMHHTAWLQRQPLQGRQNHRNASPDGV